MPKRRRKKARFAALRWWWLEAASARTLIALLCALPERLALALGALGGRASHFFFRRHRERARGNVKLAYPDWSPDQVDGLVRANFAEMGRTTAEWARHSRLAPEQILSRVEFRGLEHLEKALARGRGALVVTAHYGFWELIPSAVRLRLPHAEVVATGRTISNPFVQAIVLARRNQGGGRMLERDTADIIRALRRNAAVGILADMRRSRKRGGILSYFLGRRAWSPHGPATIARRTRCALIVAYTRRIAGTRHRIEFFRELEPDWSSDLHADGKAVTQALNDALEKIIREDPLSWLWIHRRWRRSPDSTRPHRKEGAPR
jgi:KDO2-lipid IV(A) lauroyltransferase